jgi:alkylation response protein AidB-like acyl-CoA dehydrogenase
MGAMFSIEKQAIGDLVPVAKQLRQEFSKTSAEIDATGDYPLQNMRRIHEAGLSVLCFPPEWGGLDRGYGTEGFEETVDIFTEISAGESATAQIFYVHRSACIELFSSNALSPAWKKKLHREVMEEDARICSPAAERPGPDGKFLTTCRRVDGGVVISGTKYFATGCEGARYGIVPALMEGHDSIEDGLHWGLVRLDAPGVELHHDWNNMGQRGTGSGSITFSDVFVPDGAHWEPSAGGHRSNPRLPGSIIGPISQITMSGIIIGMGYGAIDALRKHTTERGRLVEGVWTMLSDDPINQHHVGRFSSLLAAAQAANREAARLAVRFGKGKASRADLSIAMMHAKVTATDATILAASELHKLIGARYSDNKYGLDRFWRNARTLSLHDSQDEKLRLIGNYVLNNVEPPAGFTT